MRLLPRIRGEQRGAVSPLAGGLIAIALVAVGLWFAFSQENPFAEPFELEAAFRDAENLDPGSEVRIAGVKVGEVTEKRELEGGELGAAEVTMEIDDAGLPIHADAEAQVRPRLFLEGNFIVDIRPGSPTAPNLDEGDTIPINQTSSSVGAGEVLKVLEKDTRESLRTLLDELGRGLAKGGAASFRDATEFFEEAYRNTALTNDALLGREPGDLQRVLRGQQGTFAALARDPEALKDLVTNLNVTAAAFAREDDALRASVPALRDTLRVGLPALASLNDTLPSLRAFARDALPGVRSSGPALDAAQPFIEQLAGLFSEDELRGTAAELRRTVPPLARLNRRTIDFLEENRALSSCTTNVLVPFARAPIPDPDFPEQSGEPFFQDGPRSFVGLSGESRQGDANGQWFRVQVGGGATTLIETGETVEPLIGIGQFRSLGARPAPSPRPPFRPDVPCETQEPPNLEAPGAEADTPLQPTPDPGLLQELLSQLQPILDALGIDPDDLAPAPPQEARP